MDVEIQRYDIEVVYKVRIPRVDEGKIWAIRDGEVITGYHRPLPDINEEKGWEEVQDGQRVTHTEKRSSTGLSEPIGAEEAPRPGDRPIKAESFFLYIDKEGRIYF